MSSRLLPERIISSSKKVCGNRERCFEERIRRSGADVKIAEKQEYSNECNQTSVVCYPSKLSFGPQASSERMVVQTKGDSAPIDF
jgi:hypothetical protein